jgi:hypothetical protein
MEDCRQHGSAKAMFEQRQRQQQWTAALRSSCFRDWLALFFQNRLCLFGLIVVAGKRSGLLSLSGCHPAAVFCTFYE